MNPCGCFDPIAFGHTVCDRRPPHLVSEQAAQRHYEADVTRRSQWAQMAYAVARAARGAEAVQTVPGHAGIPPGGAGAVSGDRGAVHAPSGAGA